MTTRQLISLLVFFGVPLLAVFVIIGWDYWVYANWGKEGTITYAMRELARQQPSVLFLLGFLIGGIVVGLAIHFWIS